MKWSAEIAKTAKSSRAVKLLGALAGTAALLAAASLLYVFYAGNGDGGPSTTALNISSAYGDQGLELISFYGDYDPSKKEPGQPAPTLSERKEVWLWAEARAPADGQATRLGVLFPNHEGKDPYWRAVRLGILRQSSALGMDVELCASDGYEAVEQHRDQFEALLAQDVDGIILGSIHYRAMDDLVAAAANHDPPIPVVAVINDIRAPEITAKALVSFKDMGAEAGRFVLEHAKRTKDGELTIALFPGPINSGWAPDSLEGFLEVMREFDGDLTILPPSWGSPEGSVQRGLLEQVLEQRQQVDYVVGNAVAASEAIDVLDAMGLEREVTIVSTYYTDALWNPLVSGAIAAAPSDRTELLGRLAVTMLARVRAGEVPGQDIPFRAGPKIPLVTPDNVEALFPRDDERGSRTDEASFASAGCSSHRAGGTPK